MNNKDIDELNKKIDNLEMKLDKLLVKTSDIQMKNYVMVRHINFVEATYETLRAPMDYIKDSYYRYIKYDETKIPPPLPVKKINYYKS
jgi:hypothetical protein